MIREDGYESMDFFFGGRACLIGRQWGTGCVACGKGSEGGGSDV